MSDEIERLREENKRLREACEKARHACQDNLKMYMYKNEPLLMEAFKACEAALVRRRKRKRAKP